MHIGVAGQGIIGTRMAANWRRAGHAVRVWNRTPPATPPADGTLAVSPAELADWAAVVMVVVADPPAVDSVLGGPHGLATVDLRGKLILNATTVDAATSQRAAAAVAAAGGAFLETPFTGSKAAAEAGKLVFFTGGDGEALARAEPLLLQTGARVFHFGPVGRASDVKLAFNLMLANQMQALAEGFRFAQLAGVDLDTFTAAYRLNAGWCGLAEMKLPKLRERDFAPHFSLKHMDKDLRLALERAVALDARLPHTRHVKHLFTEAMNRGWGEEDFAVLYRTLLDAGAST